MDYEILIGIPVKSEESNSMGDDFSKSKPLKKKFEGNTIIFSLLNASSIEKSKITETSPDATIWISDSQENITYSQITLWLDEHLVILKTENEGTSEYKEIDNPYYVTELKNIIKKQTNLYRK